MKKHSLKIDIGLVEFLDPTLLLIGNDTSFRSLADQLSAGNYITLKQRSSRSNLLLTFIPANDEDILIREKVGFVWIISKRKRQKAAALLKQLSNCEHPAHAYLDPDVNKTGFQIMASLNEYDPTTIFE